MPNRSFKCYLTHELMLFFLDHSRFVWILPVAVQALQRCLDHIANQPTSQNPYFINYQYIKNKLKKKSKQQKKPYDSEFQCSSQFVIQTLTGKKIQLWSNSVFPLVSLKAVCVCPGNSEFTTKFHTRWDGGGATAGRSPKLNVWK